MHYLQAVALHIFVFVVMINDSQYIQSLIVDVPFKSISCQSYTCGINAKCTMIRGRPTCSCYDKYIGDPLKECFQLECQVNDDCPYSRACVSNNCVDTCVGLCGINTNCVTTNHTSICQCLPGYAGDPFSSCHLSDLQAVCKSNPCGENAKCHVINQRIVCTCLEGYYGFPPQCHHECENDNDCPSHLACSSLFRCVSPCKCGENAECEVVNHQAQCTCPKTWIGNPYISCRSECTFHSECSRSTPICRSKKCVNPCDDACGVNATCKLYAVTPVCSCPNNMIGNPFVSCRFKPHDLCNPNPCGTNAICTVYNNTRREKPVCSCRTGYIGDSVISCQRVECFTDSDCPDNRACIDFACSNPCTNSECASNATCTPRRHMAVCTCPRGTRGDALYTCNPIYYNRLSEPSKNEYYKP